MNTRCQILSSSTDEHCKIRSYLFPIGCIIYALWRGGCLLEYEQHALGKTFLNVDMTTLTTKLLSVWRCAFILQSPSVNIVFNFESPPGLMHILRFNSHVPISILFPDILTWQKKRCSVSLNHDNKDFTLDKLIAQEPNVKPMHLDPPVVSSGIPVTLPKNNWIKDNNFFLSTKNCKSLSFLQWCPVGSLYKYLLGPNDTAEVSCNIHLDKLPIKPKKSLNQSALNSWMLRWFLYLGTNLTV